MKAWVQKGVGGVENLTLQTLAAPAPKRGEVVVRVEACGANSSDWEFLTGSPYYARVAGAFRPKPRILGSDVVGIVEAVGHGVDLPMGARVVADTFGRFGGFAEVCVAKAALFRVVPDGLEPQIVAALPQSGTIFMDAFDGIDLDGRRVLINGGGGGSGPLAIQYAKHAGSHVTAVDRANKLEVMEAAGADQVLDYHQTDFAETGQTWDIILDLFGTRPVPVIERSLAVGGRYMVVGGPVPVMLGVLVRGYFHGRKHGKKIQVLGVKQGPDRLVELMRLVQTGVLRPVIGKVAPLDEADTALSEMGQGQIAGKLVISNLS